MRITVGEAVAYYREHDPRGEYVLIVGGCPHEEVQAQEDWASLTPAEHVASYMAEHPEAKKLDAIKAVAKLRGVPRNNIYQAVLSSEE